MALTDTQVRQLRAKLDASNVKTRKANGADLHYVEGWHVIAEANRIFGYDAWDRRTLASHCVWSGATGAYHGRLTPPRSALASEPEISPLCGRGRELVKARPLPLGKLMSSRSRAPRRMQRSGRLPPLATHSVLPFMTAIRLACAKHEVRRLPRQLARGSSARHLVPNESIALTVPMCDRRRPASTRSTRAR